MTERSENVELGVTQTILFDAVRQAEQEVYGNCLQAAVATVVRLPLDAVPHFSAFVWWPQALTLWAYGRGLRVMGERATAIPEIPGRTYIVGGKSPRGVAHVVVGRNGQVVWDPHPSRDGITEVTDLTWFEPRDENEPCPHLWGPVVAAMSLTDEQLDREIERRYGVIIDPTQAAHSGRFAQEAP